ncbi:MAG: hypothetical protein IT425_04060 [Pirellulales bacterium]|nr:hypothetical protein [Pirellulales bacterium]
MRNTLLLMAAIALTVLCWGLYGPTLQAGQFGMSTVAGVPARLRPFVCVGLAYFLIGVIVPLLWLYLRGEKGEWTLMGISWSLAGGALGALGAFGIILAFTFGGAPIYVMPLVFGGAPVVNAFLTIYIAGRMKEIGPMFLAGLIIVILGAVVVLVSAPHGKPHPPTAEKPTEATATKADEASVADGKEKVDANPTLVQSASSAVWSWILRVLAIALAIGSWGAYGPVLHKGQAAMHHSRMRPLLCVGVAYFVIAVILPHFFLAEMGEASSYLKFGTLWSLLGGTLGALGALGIILAFNSGGKPVFVMPLVFGGAPVINTLATIASKNQWDHVPPFFWAGLILVIAGAAMVLVLAPRGGS